MSPKLYPINSMDSTIFQSFQLETGFLRNRGDEARGVFLLGKNGERFGAVRNGRSAKEKIAVALREPPPRERVSRQ